MTSPRVLLIGGHGKVALHMTPLMLARSWHVTSLIRDPSHKDEILKLGEGQKGKVEVLVSSLEDVKSDDDAKKVLEQVKPNYVVWSAGKSRPIAGRPPIMQFTGFR
jgi:nucleoside-diphosphate-sugar epimerase